MARLEARPPRTASMKAAGAASVGSGPPVASCDASASVVAAVEPAARLLSVLPGCAPSVIPGLVPLPAGGDPCGDVMFCHVPSCGPLEMSCFVMRGRLRRAVRRGSVSVMRASFRAKGGTGCPCFARVSRACGRVSAPARFARLIARARCRAHFSRRFLRAFFALAPARNEAASGRRFLAPI